MNRAPTLTTLAAICVATVLSACSAFKDKSDYYKSVPEGRPLEVPPDLDSPPTANELTVPPAPGAVAGTGAGQAAHAPPPAGALVSSGGNELHRPENVSDTYGQVASVLQRSDLGKVINRDESGHTLMFAFDAPMEKEHQNWFKSLLGFGEGDHVKQSLTVFVTDDNGGSRIVVAGASQDAAGAYAQRRTAQELEKYVPDAKIIDNAAATAAAPAAAAPSAAPYAATPVTAAPAGGNELRRAEGVADTWNQVGSVLQRASIGKVTQRDEAGHAITFEFDAPMEKDQSWFKSVLGFEGEHVKRTLNVRVADDAGGSRITVTSANNDTAGIYAQRRTAQELAKYVPGASLIESAAPVAAAPATVAPPPAPAPAPAVAPPPPAPVASAPAPTTVPPPMSSAPSGTSNVSVGGSELKVADSVANTYARVGLALERAQIGTLSARDENAHTYTLNFSGTVETNAEGEHHWYTRVLHPFGGDKQTQQVTRQLVVRVAGDGAGAKVSVEGDTSDKLTADAAKKVIEVLRDRLS